MINQDYAVTTPEISEQIYTPNSTSMEEPDEFMRKLINDCYEPCYSIELAEDYAGALHISTKKKHKVITTSDGCFRAVLDDVPATTAYEPDEPPRETPEPTEFQNKINGNDTPMYGEESHIAPTLIICNKPAPIAAHTHAAEISDSELLELARQKLEAETPEPTEFQKKYVKAFEDFDTPPDNFQDDNFLAGAVSSITKNANFSFNQFSLNGKSADMRGKMLNDTFVLNDIAILGQSSAIYAKPNTGKTLVTIRMLVDSIEAGRIKGENVFYINADDTYKGLVTKLEIAEKYGFQMLAPNEEGFDVGQFARLLKQSVVEGTATGQILILDTVKKFTDLMDKKRSTEFMKASREFVQAGGTMIMLAHTNKNRDLNGKVVAAGTSDIIDDCDCAFILDELPTSTETEKHIIFENIKSRGNVARELALTYSNAEKQDYCALFESVRVAHGIDTREAKARRDAMERLEKDDLVIEGIKTALQNGISKRSEIIDYCNKNKYAGRNKVDAILQRYIGTKLTSTTFWRVMDMPNNGKCYYILTDSNDYQKVKDGD
jgi:hypothetical protein